MSILLPFLYCSLGYNKIGPEGATAIAKVLEVNRVLTNLHLSDNRLCGVWKEDDVRGGFHYMGTNTAEGINAIAKALKVNRVLTTLVLSFNGIGDEGAKALASALEVNAVLTSCDLSQNRICFSGASELASALKGHPTLLKLITYVSPAGLEKDAALKAAYDAGGVMLI